MSPQFGNAISICARIWTSGGGASLPRRKHAPLVMAASPRCRGRPASRPARSDEGWLNWRRRTNSPPTVSAAPAAAARRWWRKTRRCWLISWRWWSLTRVAIRCRRCVGPARASRNWPGRWWPWATRSDAPPWVNCCTNRSSACKPTARRAKARDPSRPQRPVQAYLDVQVRALPALADGQPVISVDTKKKELGRGFQGLRSRSGDPKGKPAGSPHARLSWIKELGKVIPYGVYDLVTNATKAGSASASINDTAAIRRCVTIRPLVAPHVGQERYPNAKSG